MADHGDELRMYIVVNMDAKMGKGKVAAQVGHAVMYVTEYLLDMNRSLYTKYKRNSMPKIVLGAKAEVINQLEENHTNIFVVRDAGRTQVEAGTLTAIGFIPMTETQRDKSYPELKSLKLL